MIKFNEVRVVVTCQYYENYAFFENGEAWKPKGSHQFTFIIDNDEWLYCSEEVVKPMVEQIIANKCNGHSRYEVLGYDTIFEDMEDISKMVAMLCKEQYDNRNAAIVDSIIP